MYSSIYINVRRLYTTFEVQRELDGVVMTVRQRVTSVLENESFIVERIKTQDVFYRFCSMEGPGSEHIVRQWVSAHHS